MRLSLTTWAAIVAFSLLTACGGGGADNEVGEIIEENPPAPTGPSQPEQEAPALLETLQMNRSGFGVKATVERDASGDWGLWVRTYQTGVGYGSRRRLDLGRFINVGGPSILHVASSGHAVIGWAKQFADNTTDARMAIYDPATGSWSAPIDLEALPTVISEEPAVRINSRGQVLAAWFRRPNPIANRNLYAATFDPNTVFSREPVESDAGDAYNFRLALNAEGRGVVAWSQEGPIRRNLFARQFDVNAGVFGATEQLDAVSAVGDTRAYEARIDREGRITVGWTEEVTLGVDQPFATRYVPATGWAARFPLHAAFGEIQDLDIPIDGDGNAHAVWVVERNGSQGQVLARRYDAASDIWGPIREVSPTNVAEIEGVTTRGNRDGRLVVTWDERAGDRTRYVSALYTPGQPWSSPIPLGETDENASSKERLADLTPTGGTIVYTQRDAPASYRLYLRTFDANGPTGDPVLLNESVDQIIPELKVRFDDAGRALILWQEKSPGLGDESIWQNEIL